MEVLFDVLLVIRETFVNFNLIGEWIGWLRKDLSGVE